jgi:hypothetical protein
MISEYRWCESTRRTNHTDHETMPTRPKGSQEICTIEGLLGGKREA